jgi:FdrA protein
MSAREVAIKKNRYFDSVFLMAVARRLSDQPGIDSAAAVMGSPANQAILVEMGFVAGALEAAGPNDLVVALQGDSDAIRGLAENIEEWLVRPKTELAGTMAFSFDDALQRQATSNLAVISVPGEYAAREADIALDHGLNVFLFSDHVAVEDEIALKRKASDAGLIVMGPDCGTAILAGTGIGFANVVRRGTIGVVAASGTGLQEFTCLVHRAGSGVSHGFGTGGRDLSDAVGGLSTLAAIDALEEDAATTVIAIVSKPPGESTLRRIVDRLDECDKPVAACFLGLPLDALPEAARFKLCSTVDEAVSASLRLAGADTAELSISPVRQLATRAKRETDRMSSSQRYVRGLFAGGTFCYQAQQVMRDGGIAVTSNAPLEGMRELDDPHTSIENTLIDMGADEFTVGTPHPMIDSTQRARRIRAEAEDPQVAVLLLDFILGYNASSDPVGDLVEAIGDAKRVAASAGRYLAVVASVCGTDEDPQDLNQQERSLRDVGAIVFASNVQASSFARDVVLRREEVAG